MATSSFNDLWSRALVTSSDLHLTTYAVFGVHIGSSLSCE